MSTTRRASPRARRAREADLAQIYECQAAAYRDYGPGGLCEPRTLELQLEAFPEGQFVVEERGKIIGYATSLIVSLDDAAPWYSYGEVTGEGSFSTHTPSGDTLYGADIAVHPDHRGRGVAKALYEARRRLMTRLNLRRLVAGGRIPGYAQYAGKLRAEQYVEQVVAGKLTDPALSVHLSAGYEVLGVHLDYLADAQSLNYATALQMRNPRYNPERRRIAASPMKRPVRKIRVCSAQYQMRPLGDWSDFEHQVSFFVETAQQYHCHFLLLPELFTVQLFSLLDPDIEPKAAIERLAEWTERYRDMFSAMAKRSGLYIVAGSHPVRVGDTIRNVAHLFAPDGSFKTQEKLHITPNETSEYGIEPGEGLFVFDTGLARVAICICYDIEFPEVARLLTLAGAEVLFVPFSTDERKAYLRVRYCGQARAVENTVYTVLSGNTGNLPQVRNFLINYGEAVICTPCDFAFPTDGVAGRADSSGETVVIGDLDLVALQEAREMGSVRPLRALRRDIYQLSPTTPVRVERL